MKLLLYSHFCAPSVGGVESIVLSLATGLAEICGADGRREFEITLATQIAAGAFNDNSLPFPVIRQPSLFELLKLIRSADVVHIAGPSLAPLVMGWLCGKVVVIEHHGFQTICPTGQLLIEPGGVPCPGHFMAGRHIKCLECRPDKNWLASLKLWSLTFVRRFLCSRADANIMPTDWLGRLTNVPKSATIPHGIEMVVHNSGPQVLSGPPRIVFQGRLVTTKGLPLLLEAASILRLQNREFELLVIGDGPERAAIQRLACNLDISSHVHFAGSVPAAELDSMFAAAKIVVVPSLGGEVFGLVLAETMSRGLPIVASDLGSFSEVLADTGLLFRIGDARGLAAQIGRLLDDPAFASQLGLRARARISERYLRADMIDAHAELYRRLRRPVQPGAAADSNSLC
jgi:glycosyltransferase involved in cell wall biosynthesis